jgi:hypothetical protein
MLTKIQLAENLINEAIDELESKSTPSVGNSGITNKDIGEYNTKVNKAVDIYKGICLSFETPIEKRVEALVSMLWHIENEGIDMLSRYRDMLGSNIFKDEARADEIVLILKSIVKHKINIHEKIITLVCLLSRGHSDVYSNFIDIAFDPEATFTQRSEACKFLFASNSDEYIENAQECLLNLIEPPTLSDVNIAAASAASSKERYSAIAQYITKGKRTIMRSIYNKQYLLDEYVTDEKFVFALQHSFFFNRRNEIRERLLSGRHLLTISPDIVSPETRTEIINEILTIAENTELTENNRGDACDTLLHYGSPESIIRSKEILRTIGFSKAQRTRNNLLQGAKIFYNDSQNIHQVSDETLITFAEKVASDTTVLLSFEECVDGAIELMRKYVPDTLDGYEEKRFKIKSSLHHIKEDVTTFTHYHMNTAEIFTYVYTRIARTPEDDINKGILEELLVDELYNMDETCPSGHAVRFVLVLSLVDGNISISYDKQIAANIAARFNAKVQSLTKVSDTSNGGSLGDSDGGDGDEDLQGALVNAFFPNPDEEDLRKYREFMKTYRVELFDELRSEFVPSCVSLVDFEKAFKEGMKEYDL